MNTADLSKNKTPHLLSEAPLAHHPIIYSVYIVLLCHPLTRHTPVSPFPHIPTPHSPPPLPPHHHLQFKNVILLAQSPHTRHNPCLPVPLHPYTPHPTPSPHYHLQCIHCTSLSPPHTPHPLPPSSVTPLHPTPHPLPPHYHLQCIHCSSLSPPHTPHPLTASQFRYTPTPHTPPPPPTLSSTVYTLYFSVTRSISNYLSICAVVH